MQGHGEELYGLDASLGVDFADNTLGSLAMVELGESGTPRADQKCNCNQLEQLELLQMSAARSSDAQKAEDAAARAAKNARDRLSMDKSNLKNLAKTLADTRASSLKQQLQLRKGEAGLAALTKNVQSLRTDDALRDHQKKVQAKLAEVNIIRKEYQRSKVEEARVEIKHDYAKKLVQLQENLAAAKKDHDANTGRYAAKQLAVKSLQKKVKEEQNAQKRAEAEKQLPGEIRELAAADKAQLDSKKLVASLEDQLAHSSGRAKKDEKKAAERKKTGPDCTKICADIKASQKKEDDKEAQEQLAQLNKKNKEDEKEKKAKNEVKKTAKRIEQIKEQRQSDKDEAKRVKKKENNLEVNEATKKKAQAKKDLEASKEKEDKAKAASVQANENLQRELAALKAKKEA